jgi:hypothetical protein
MKIITRTAAVFWACVICLALVLPCSCQYGDPYTGIYGGERRILDRQEEVTLELKSGGEGVWRVGADEVPFSWYVKSGELRVNTRTGGVITGSIQGKTIEITLPGSMKITFRKK